MRKDLKDRNKTVKPSLTIVWMQKETKKEKNCKIWDLMIDKKLCHLIRLNSNFQKSTKVKAKSDHVPINKKHNIKKIILVWI